MTRENQDQTEKLKENYRSKAFRFFNHDLGNLRQIEQGYRELIESLEEEIEETEDTAEMIDKARQVRDKQETLEKTREKTRPMRERAEEIYENPGVQSIDFREMMQDSIDSMRPLIEENGNSVSVNWAADDYTIESYMVLERAVYNIIDNALEHGDQDVEIDVTGSWENLIVSVDESYDGDITDIYSSEFETATKGSELVRETIDDLGIDIYNTEDSYELRIPRHLPEDNQA
jgi:signal transduction histidine kinase